jgi:hypothetical protein
MEAGALTFFPPKPMLYKFEWHHKGCVLEQDEDPEDAKKKQQNGATINNVGNKDSIGTIEDPTWTGPLEIEETYKK